MNPPRPAKSFSCGENKGSYDFPKNPSLLVLPERSISFIFPDLRSIEQLKLELGLLQPIAVADQILLFGPPYKSFDSQVIFSPSPSLFARVLHGSSFSYKIYVFFEQYRPDINLENKRIFLFNRRVISDETLPNLPRPISTPTEIPHPDPIPSMLID